MGLLTNYVIVLGWILTLAFSIAAGLAILAKLLDLFTGELNVWKEIRRKNLAMGIVLGATILALAMVVSKL